MGSITKALFPGERMLSPKEKCFDKPVEKETCFVSITSNFADVSIAQTARNPSIFYQKMSVLYFRRSTCIITDILHCGVLNAEVYNASRYLCML